MKIILVKFGYSLDFLGKGGGGGGYFQDFFWRVGLRKGLVSCFCSFVSSKLLFDMEIEGGSYRVSLNFGDVRF